MRNYGGEEFTVPDDYGLDTPGNLTEKAAEDAWVAQSAAAEREKNRAISALIDAMRPMDEAPRDGTIITIFTNQGVISAFWADVRNPVRRTDNPWSTTARRPGWQRITCHEPFAYWPCDPAHYGLDPAEFRGWTEA